jgi:hypothetical protein
VEHGPVLLGSGHTLVLAGYMIVRLPADGPDVPRRGPGATASGHGHRSGIPAALTTGAGSITLVHASHVMGHPLFIDNDRESIGIHRVLFGSIRHPSSLLHKTIPVLFRR